MTDKKRPIELRSEEMQEVLGTLPGWLVQWGATIIFLALLLLLFVAHSVRYPDSVKGPLQVSEAGAAQEISIPVVELERLLLADSSMVTAGALLAVLNSQADFREIGQLDTLVRRLAAQPLRLLPYREIPAYRRLGELQPMYDRLRAEIVRVRSWRSPASADAEARQRNISALQGSIRILAQAESDARQELEALEKLLGQQTRDWEQGKLTQTKVDLTRARINRLNKQLAACGSGRQAKQTDLEILNLGGDIALDTAVFDALKITLAELTTQVGAWKRKHLLFATASGRLLITPPSQASPTGNLTLSIGAKDKKARTGFLIVPRDAGKKVVVGQRALIRVKTGPELPRKILEGRVLALEVPGADSATTITIEIFGEGNRLSSESLLDPWRAESAIGEVEVICGEKSMLSRWLELFFSGIFKDA
jgi:HlyD family secretion protein